MMLLELVYFDLGGLIRLCVNFVVTGVLGASGGCLAKTDVHQIHGDAGDAGEDRVNSCRMSSESIVSGSSDQVPNLL